MTTRVIIGVGNEFRGDDGAGPAVVDQLRDRALPGVRLVVSDGDPVAMMDAWDDAESVIVVDAVVSGGDAGTVYIWHDSVPPASQPVRSSSHQLDLADTLALAGALSRSPHRLVVIGIEVAVVTPGQLMTPEVSAGVDRATDLAAALCCHPSATPGPGVLYA
jgi:hydrogenase maturation protease